MNDIRSAQSVAHAVVAQGLIKRYGETVAVAGLDLEIPSGQFFGLLGPNGSGKTTTIHILSTLVRPTSGGARVAGHDVIGEPVAVRASIGLVFQDSALDRTLSVRENLRFAGLLYGLPPAVIEQRSRELLEMFGLNDKRERPVGSLSGGMRRALDIVRGVIHYPRILFLDEPTIGLDLPNRRNIWRFIERLRAARGTTVLLTTHYLEEADGCDQVAFIKSGRIVQRGTPRELVAALGRHIVEIEAPDLDPLIDAVRGELGPALKDGDVAMFRYPEEDLAGLSRLQADVGSRISALRIRRPNLNDVFLWVNAPR
ncbi:MAG TPA: ATP-binding cassette domain-containing protein [Burkholderiales bacterium]|nr:ATP-binding cassette domain-containing protein [Burkholderiales bacterium]